MVRPDGRRGLVQDRSRRRGRWLHQGRRLSTESPLEPAVPEPGGGGLVRLRLDLAYDGTDFAGWAAQPGQRTVEELLSAALATVLRVPLVRLVVAGRTDAGVHATGQVCHCDVPRAAFLDAPGRTTRTPASALLIRLASVLPVDIRVSAVSKAPAGFDARFSAVQRRYSYRVCDDPSGVPPLRRRDVLWSRSPLSVEAMDDAARRLVGLRDFAAFCKRREGATTVRTLLTYSWARASDGLVVGRVEADAFCHSMVRALVGAVLPVGQGKQGPDWPIAVLTAGVRSSGVAVVPPHGLVLEEVTYPPDPELALRAQQARSVRTLP